MVISEVQTRILEALARFRFLTHSQMADLGIGNIAYLRKVTRTFSRAAKPLLGVLTFPVSARIGGMEHVFFLTRHGAVVLGGLVRAVVPFPKSTPTYLRDYWHRKSCIDVHIWLTKALAKHSRIELARFDRYFDFRDTSRIRPLRAATCIDFADEERFFVPDLNFVIRSTADTDRKALYSLEMTNSGNTKRVLNQIHRHTAAMEQGVLSRAYELPEQNYLALFLFAEATTMQAVRSRFAEVRVDSAAFQESFLFAELAKARHDILRCWQNCHGEGFVHLLTGAAIPP